MKIMLGAMKLVAVILYRYEVVILQDDCNDGLEFSTVVSIGPAPMMVIVMRPH